LHIIIFFSSSRDGSSFWRRHENTKFRERPNHRTSVDETKNTISVDTHYDFVPGSVDDVHPTTHPSIDDPLATNRLIERRLRMPYYHHTSGGVRPCVRVCCELVCVCVRAGATIRAGSRALVCACRRRSVLLLLLSSSTSTSTHNIILHLQSSVPCVVLRVRVCSVSVRFFFFFQLPVPFIPL